MTSDENLPTSSLAIASVAFGVGGILILGIPCGIAAIVLAAMAKKSIDQGQRVGIGLVITGMILGVIDIAGFIAWRLIVAGDVAPEIPTYVI